MMFQTRFPPLLHKLVMQRTFKDPSVKANGFVIRKIVS